MKMRLAARNWAGVSKMDIALTKLAEYLETFDRSEGKSPATARWHLEAIRVFVAWLERTGRPTNLGAVGEYEARQWVLWMQQKTWRGHPLSVTTINTRVRALRYFFGWLHAQKYTDQHLLAGLKPPRLPRIMVETLSDEEVGRIFACLDLDTMAGSRDAAMLSLLLDTGLRISELTGLKVGDVHLEEQYVKVLGKGSKERIVAFGTSTKKALLRYLMHFRGEPAHPTIASFFLTLDGYGVTNEGFKSSLRRLAKAVGIRRLHPHLCRHTYATNFLLNGGDALLLKQNLGHTTLAMVDRYVHLATSRAALVSREFSPLDRLNLSRLRRSGSPPVSGQMRAFQKRLVKPAAEAPRQAVGNRPHRTATQMPEAGADFRRR